MHNSLRLLCALVLAVSLNMGCGQGGDNYLTGVTGGDENGYGHRYNDHMRNGLDFRLFGRWTPLIHWEEVRYLTLRPDSSANFSVYTLGALTESNDGTWWADGYHFEIHISGFIPESGWYTVSKGDVYFHTSERYYYYVRPWP